MFKSQKARYKCEYVCGEKKVNLCMMLNLEIVSILLNDNNTSKYFLNTVNKNIEKFSDGCNR